MSKQNVEMVRAGIEAFNRGDWDAALKEAAPDFEMDLSQGVGPDRGRLPESWQIEPQEFVEGGEQVVATWTFRATGRDGIEVEANVTWTFTIREGEIARTAYFPTRREALAAAGLSE
jgi:ketosteroid isomerase-like protein